MDGVMVWRQHSVSVTHLGRKLLQLELVYAELCGVWSCDTAVSLVAYRVNRSVFIVTSVTKMVRRCWSKFSHVPVT